MQPEDSSHFDQLAEWAQLEENELKSIHSAEMSDVLGYLQKRLGPSYDWPKVITKEEISNVVTELQYLVKDGSRKLGAVIIEGCEMEENGNLTGAIEVFSKFVSECPSPCYVEVAKHYLKNYGAEIT